MVERVLRRGAPYGPHRSWLTHVRGRERWTRGGLWKRGCTDQRDWGPTIGSSTRWNIVSGIAI